jgi:hypothetical protein
MTLQSTSFRSFILTVLVLLMASGCRPDAAPPPATPSATVNGDAAPVDATATTESEPAGSVLQETTPALSASAYPSGVETGIIDIDAVIAAALSGDPEQLRPLLGLLTTPCTLAEGLGGPPKCTAGEAEGSEVTAFPFLGSEGGFAREDELDGLLDSLDIGGLYGVYIVPRDAAEEPYWPSGDYGLVFTGNGTPSAYTLLMAEGRVVRIVYHMGQSPAEAFDSGRGEIILSPLE